MINPKQQPSDLKVLNIRYQYVGASNPYKGKVAILPPEYRWLLDIHNDGVDGPPVSQEWIDFDNKIYHYIDLAMGESLEDLYKPDNPFGFYVLEHWHSVSSSKLEAMAAKAMEEHYAGLTEPLDPDTM